MAKARARAAAAQVGLPRRIAIHVSKTLAAFDRQELAADLERAAPALPKLEFGDDLAAAPGARAFLAQLAGFRVRDPVINREFYTATSKDLEFEELIDTVPSQVPSADLVSRLYDGTRVAQAALPMLADRERSTGTLHLWITRRLLATYSPNDLRYHARFAVFGYPVVFSVLGLALAPAPSLEAALFARELARRGADAGQIEAEIDRQYPEERIDIDEPGTVTAAVASAVLQAAAAASLGQAFCADPACRLFNAHRKRELRASLLGGSLCATHARLFMARGPVR